MLLQHEVLLNLYCYSVWYLVEHYLFKMFHWYLLVGNFVICFWINLFFKIAFHTHFLFDLICLFWVNSVYLLCCFSRKFFSILSLIFGWTLSVQDVSLISFGRKFCNLFLDQFGFRTYFWYLFCFWLDLPVLGQ